FATRRVSAPITASCITIQPGPTTARAPILAPASMQTYGPIDADSSTSAPASITAVGCRPGGTSGAGCNSAAIRAYAAYGLSVTSAATGVSSANCGASTTAPARVVRRNRL